jgi:diguanylate cyclase (GGDEF)-like protein/PAS domain S-box-containing protein
MHDSEQVSPQAGTRWRETARVRRGFRLLDEMVKVAAAGLGESALLMAACRIVRQVGGYPAVWCGLSERPVPGGVQWFTQDAALGAVAGMGTGVRLAAAIELVERVAAVAMSRGDRELTHPLPVDAAGAGLGVGLAGLDAMLALPLRVAGVVVGAIVVGAAAGNVFGEIELQSLTAVTVELGLALQLQRACAARAVAEQQQRFNLKHFRAVLSSQQVAILVMSENDRVKFANEAFCTLFGLPETPLELENQPATAMLPRLLGAFEHPEQERLRIAEILQRGEVVVGDRVAVTGGRVLLRDFTPIQVDGVPQGRMWHQRDVTEQKRHDDSVERLAFCDELTGLPNRRRLFQLLECARAQAARQRSLLAVGVLDLDRFKAINDTIGHHSGDQVLVEATSRILGLLREADVLASFGGDEFALVIAGLDSKEQLDAISRCILQALRVPFELLGEPIRLSASVGWTLFPLDDADAERLVRHADLAMYAAKGEGKDRGLLYQPAMELEQLRLQAMRDQIAQALGQSDLHLLFQPIVFIDGLAGLQGVAGMEALLRLYDPEQGLIEPVNFMHVLDDPQLARPIGRYVLDEALKQCQAWLRSGVSLPVAVNISTRHLLHPAFFSDIDAALEAYPGVMDVGFGIEVTETGPSMDHARAKVVIEECRRRGIRVGLDDFGTGSASLSHIQQLDIEHIKLDQSFVRDILDDERNIAIAAGVITTARMLAKTVIAEGVETLAQGDLLASLGCHQLQGFSIARPMPGAEVPAWVARWVPPVSWERLVSERQSLLAGQLDNAS